MKRFAELYSLCSFGRCSEQESFSRFWRWFMGLQLMREKVVHLVCSRSCHGLMCLWESTELQAAAWKMCTAAMSAPPETPWTRHCKDPEENPSAANTWNAHWGRSVKVHKLRPGWVSHHSEQRLDRSEWGKARRGSSEKKHCCYHSSVPYQPRAGAAAEPSNYNLQMFTKYKLRKKFILGIL